MASQAWLDYLKSSGVNSGTSEPTAEQLQPSPVGGTLGDLASVYSKYKGGNAVSGAYGAGADQAQQQAQTLQDQMSKMPTLESLYGQDSPYAKQLQQTLAAKDAAAGRNSQYGQRSVQLQADLASHASQYGQAQAQMASQYSQAMQQAQNAHTQATIGQQQTNSQQLAGLLGVAQKSGALQAGANGLAGLYQQYTGNGNNTPTNQPMADSPYGGGGNYQGYTNGQDTPAVDPNAQYQSNGGLGQMYGTDQSNYAPGMNTNQAPTSANNAYSMDDWLQ